MLILLFIEILWIRNEIGRISLCEYEIVISVLVSYLDSYPAHIEIYALVSTLYSEIGNHQRAKYYYMQSLIYVPYSRNRVNHSIIKDRLTSIEDLKEVNSVAKVHYITVASNHNKYLSNLLRSAEISGVHITVLGLNQGYKDLGQKGMDIRM